MLQATCQTLSSTVPSTHLTIATGRSPRLGCCGLPPQMRSTSALISCSGRMGSFEPLTASIRSWRRGLMAMPRSVTTTSINSPGPHSVVTSIDDDGNAVAERGHGQDGAPRGQAVLPAADAVQKASVGVGDHIGIEVHVDFGRAQHDRIHHRREVSFPVVVIRSKWRSRDVARIAGDRLARRRGRTSARRECNR